jgi:putative ABC transport system permease protein
MDYSFLFQISFESLSTHKLRTFLTMLGVIIGVAAVVAMLSIGEGAKQEALEQISILGINNVIVNARIPQEQAGSDFSLQRSPGLSLADGENIAEFKEMVSNVVPQRFEPIETISYRSSETPARVVATTPNFIYSSSIEVESGRFINDVDIRDFSQVCVLGAKAKKNLFAFDDPHGRKVRIGDYDFTVVGVMADKYIGRGKVEGLNLKNFNEDVYIPLSTAQKKMERVSLQGEAMYFGGRSASEQERAYNIPEIDQLTVTVTDLKYIPAVTKLVERVTKL